MSIFTLRSEHHLPVLPYDEFKWEPQPSYQHLLLLLTTSAYCISFSVKYFGIHYSDFFSVTIALGNKLENQGLKRLYMTFSMSHS